MANYSHFRFDELSTEKITSLMLKSFLVHDDEFALACRENLKRRTTKSACSCNPPVGYPHLPSCKINKPAQGIPSANDSRWKESEQELLAALTWYLEDDKRMVEAGILENIELRPAFAMLQKYRSAK